jgi:hypothetical protein
MMTEAQIQKITAQTPPEIAAVLTGDLADIAGETGAALGVGYQCGALTVPPLTLGVLPLLEAIDSPLVDDKAGDDFRISDIIRALYVMCRGFEATAGIMAMYRRKAALHAERERATKSPEIYEVYLRRVDALESEWIEFDRQASEFWEAEVGNSISVAGAAEVLARALRDALSGLAAIPKGEKKKAAGLMRNGLRA